MKKLIYSIAIMGVFALMVSCGSNTESKADSWTAEQEQVWKDHCNGLLTKGGQNEATAADYCDCIFEKTAEKYTPEEAGQITPEQEQEIWDQCDYSW
jgi:hypothetical protein